jgi:hypothetical protein
LIYLFFLAVPEPVSAGPVVARMLMPVRQLSILLAGLVLASHPADLFAAESGRPESVSPIPITSSIVADISIRVPVGLDSAAPPGADLTGGLSEIFSSDREGAGPAAGEGEWVFVPIPFKNALLGAGLQFGAGRLYKQAGKQAQTQASMFGVGGMYAEGGSWAAAGGDRRYWGHQADIRSTLVGGAGEVFYPLVVISSDLINVRIPVSQQFTGGLVKLGYEAREHLWLNAGFKFATTDIRATGVEITDENRSLALAPRISIDLALLDLSAEWDSRSDQFYPREGSLGSLDIALSNTAYGADSNYVVYGLSYSGYHAFGERHTLAWRLAGKYATGSPPFFALPWYGSGVDLRGYTPGTYIGKSLAAAQLEWRWQATKRIGLVAFGGVGGVWGDVPVFEQEDFLPAGGVGIRWRLTDKFRVNFRVDYAWGKDDEVLLVSVGEAF